MLKKLTRSSGIILGYEVTDKITKEDYVTLTDDIKALVQQGDSINLLLDLRVCTGEDIKAWGPELKFRRDYRKYIAKMAIIGDKKWQEWLPAFVDLFDYAREAETFSTSEQEAAWEWLQTKNL